ncbi:MAG TPA: LuxR C-terminal-related transcriptional regulator, partial [Opitutus sp.]|nr:LuxR C-terminal-related transcriptional regulator [Opitutus sp.]
AHLGLGMNDEEIGDVLHMSPRTAQTHRSNIMKKLLIAGTPKLVAFAVHNGFTRPLGCRPARAKRLGPSGALPVLAS